MSFSPIAVIDHIKAGMTLSSLRHEVIASNIANRETEGYRRLQLQFDGAMNRAGAAAVVAVDSATPVSLEDDLVALSSNALRYQAMASTLSRYFSIIAAICEPSRG